MSSRLALQNKTAENFAREYYLQCPLALERIREGRPITVRDDKGNALKIIAEIVESVLVINLIFY